MEHEGRCVGKISIIDCIKKNIGLLWIPLMIFFYVRNNPNIKFYSLTYIQVLLLFVCCILFSASGGFNDRCWMIKMVSSWRYLYFIYIAFTIYMFLDSSAINFVCNLFPDAASTILNQYHNAGIGIECEPIRVDDYTNKKMTFFHDPDGLPLELHE